MFDRSRKDLLSRFGLVFAAAALLSGPARANTTGVKTSFCDVSWEAQSVMTGDPGYSTSGFLIAVSNAADPTAGPGVLSFEHFYTGSPVTMNWRLPVATNYLIQNAQVGITMPPESLTGAAVFSPPNAAGYAGLVTYFQTRRGDLDPGYVYVPGVPAGPSTYYSWSAPWAADASNTTPAPPYQSSYRTWTFSLGDLAARSATATQMTATMPVGTDMTQHFFGNATLTGTYLRGNPSDPATSPTCVYSSAAVGDAFALGQVGGATLSVLNNDSSKDGAAAVAGAGGNVTLTPGPSPVAGMTMNPDGTITVPAGTAAGSYSYSYQICPTADPDPAPAPAPSTCSTATATVNVAQAAAVAAVPTLAAWSVMLLGVLLGGLGMVGWRRRG